MLLPPCGWQSWRRWSDLGLRSQSPFRWGPRKIEDFVGKGGAPKPTEWARKCPWGARERPELLLKAKAEESGLCDDAEDAQ